ncbi:hypothetical protein MBRA_00490 [Methylobacterium brachiatum]|jgi:hypothetical protein|nr:PRC-barrel domain containing protein [Methylobacterium brachiatum]CAA2154812.1 hypothetical protein MBRA_00490 [Methylobacterium brachiatum]
MGSGTPFSRAHSGPPEISMRRLVLATLAASALAGPALAANTAPPTVAPKFESVPQDAVLSYNLIGLNITDAENNTVGEIKDLAIVHEKLVGYIVSVGGFLGMGERYVAVSPSSVALGYDADAKKWKAIIGATKDQLKSAPEFKYDGKFKR